MGHLNERGHYDNARKAIDSDGKQTSLLQCGALRVATLDMGMEIGEIMKLHTPSRKGAVMSKYTPGPWKVDESEHHAMGGERIYKVITDRPMGGLVADVSAWWVDTESARHNAHLIAAAPAMYEALQSLLAVYIESTDDSGSPVVLNAQDAIAQAEGGTL